MKPRFSQADWSNLVPGLERGDFDVAMNGLEDTPARRGRILLSLPYFAFGETLAVRRGSKARSLAALFGQRVGTLNQSYAYDLLRTRDVEPVLYEGVSEPYTDLELGRVDAVLLDHVIADRYGCPRPKLECVPGDVATGTYVIGVRKGDQRLRDALDAALVGMERDGELERILERWKLWDPRQVELSQKLLGEQAADAPLGPSATARSLAQAAGGGSVPDEPNSAARRFTMADAALFLRGAGVTLLLSFAAFALALPLGLLLAISRLDSHRLPRWLASAYLELFRGTPLLLQLYVLYYALAPFVRMGPLTAAVLGLAMNYAAYEAEIHRGALLAVPHGQGEAARSLGLGRWQALRHVLLPQSLRIALPAMTNHFVSLLKDSSLKRRPPARALGWTKAAGRHRSRAREQPEGAPPRRTHERPRTRTRPTAWPRP